MTLVVMDLFKNTWKDAHEKDPSIKQSDVKEWFEQIVKIKCKGSEFIRCTACLL